MAYNDQQGPSRYWIKEVFDEFLVVEDGAEDYAYYQVDYTKSDESINFTPRGEWPLGKYEFVTISKSASESEEKGQGTLPSGQTLEIEIEQEQLEIAMA